ncbi:MAG: 3-phosphoshikimate 1-carboxyvinyltransferase, partial [Endomicrobiales bacterium]
MDWIIKPSLKMQGECVPPADKSITHRAIMMAALADGRSVIENYLPADDCMHTLQAFIEFGVPVE